MKNDLPPILDVNETFYFRVIGEDRKIHISDLQTDKCKCGIKIIRNFVIAKDYNELFSCYECTY